jgi:hypothetical protein
MRGRVSVVAILAVMAAVAPCLGQGVTLRPGAVELGISGSFTSVEGTTTSRFGIGVGQYRAPGGVLIRYAGTVAHERISDLDVLDFEAALTAFLRMGDANSWAFLGAAVGIRQEWIGSFSDDLYPVGFDAGLKLLASSSAAGTIAYQYRRVMGDPVSDFNEHRLVIGLSLFFRNAKE